VASYGRPHAARCQRLPFVFPFLLTFYMWVDMFPIELRSQKRLLFVNRRGRPFSVNKLREKQLHPLLDALGIPRGGFHSMRHGAASSLLDDGAAPAVVQKQLRHSDARITLELYGHVVGVAQRGSKPLNKAGQLRTIVRKLCFVRKSSCKSLKTTWVGRGGGDRTRTPFEFAVIYGGQAAIWMSASCC
jgi:integrase-like protein